jgi:hypothetical protein
MGKIFKFVIHFRVEKWEILHIDCPTKIQYHIFFKCKLSSPCGSYIVSQKLRPCVYFNFSLICIYNSSLFLHDFNLTT